MESIEIKGAIRKNIGKNFTKQIRKDGQVPCCLYGGKENINFQSHELSFKNLIYTPNVYLVNLEIEGTKYESVLQDIQFHPVTDRIMHVDFMEIKEGKKVKIGLPVKLTGDSEGVKQGGKLHLKKRTIKVKGLPGDLPGFLEINISDLGLGKTKKIKDLSYENLELLDPPNDVVCSVKLTRASKGEEAAEGAGVEGVEGAAETAVTTEGGTAEGTKE